MTRPLPGPRLGDLAATLMPRADDAPPLESPVAIHRLRGYDPLRGERGTIDADDAVVQTVSRRGRPALRAALVADS